jgi:BirA family biotin operon repressor/biotin-[acetyl-CoA-carboxylase] ligase
LFDLEKFDLKLSTEIIGRNFIYADKVPSTNSELLNQPNYYSNNGTVLLAEKQTSGRGRKNRTWDSAEDMNLTFSVLITNEKHFKKNINLINYAASLAVASAIENLYQLRTELKWPNDVLVDGKKIAGILMESVSQGSKISRLVIGIGLNVNQISFQGKYSVPPTSLKKEIGHPVDREKTLAEILNIFEKLIELSLKPSNKILKEWKSKCRMIGERITVHIDDTSKQGIFHDIDEKGFLVLRIDDKLETLHTGDVSIT